MPSPVYITGLDLGQISDFSALAILEKSAVDIPVEVGTPIEDMPKDQRWKARPNRIFNYTLVHLERFDTGTKYTQVVERCIDLFSDPRLRGSMLIPDGTGVGIAVCDMLVEARVKGVVRYGDKQKLQADIRPITITQGAGWKENGRGWRVAKKELASVIQVLLQSRRIKFIEALKDEGAPLDILVKELENFQVKVTPNANETFECLLAGTLISTSVGQVPIEEITTSHRVLTRHGYKRVLGAKKTKDVAQICTVEFSNGLSIRGTRDHLVYTANRGWRELGDLTCQDHILQCHSTEERAQKPRSSYLEERAISGRQAMATTLSQRKGSEQSFIEWCGSSTTDQYQTDTISTTTTKIRTTTIYPTWYVLVIAITGRYTDQNSHQPLRPARLARKSLSAAQVGEQELLTDSTARYLDSALCHALSRECHIKHMNAITAGSHLSQRDQEAVIDIAQTNVKMRSCTEIGQDRQRRASSAERGLDRSIKHLSTARVAALPATEYLNSKVPVYDILVEDHPEFFANGILVHNSARDSLHDDLVLSVAMAAWVGERGMQQMWIR